MTHVLSMFRLADDLPVPGDEEKNGINPEEYYIGVLQVDVPPDDAQILYLDIDEDDALRLPFYRLDRFTRMIREALADIPREIPTDFELREAQEQEHAMLSYALLALQDAETSVADMLSVLGHPVLMELILGEMSDLLQDAPANLPEAETVAVL